MPKMTRRTFLWVTGGTGITVAAATQRKLVNKLIPQIIPPENIPPGEWVQFATTCRECPAGCGMHLWHRDGRVTKAEGNPVHPVNRGTLCPRGQASLQGLYDPDRLPGVLFRPRGGKEERRNWDDAVAAIGARLAEGGRAHLLSNLQTGALAEVMRTFAASYNGTLLFHEPFSHEAIRKAHALLFGLPLIPEYRLDRCRFIVSFAADFLETWISPVSHARQHAEMHSWSGSGTMNRMAYVGPRLSMTAANADDFIQVPPGWERVVAATMLKTIIDRGWGRGDIGAFRPAVERLVAAAGPVPGVSEDVLVTLARRFTLPGGSVALPGPVGSASPAAVETGVLCALLNLVAGRIGDTVDFSRPHALSRAASEEELDRFFSGIAPRDVLFVHGTNPLYSRPATATPIGRAGLVVCLGTLPDETAAAADWVLPVDYPLESWGDYEPAAGVHGLLQPTMARLGDSRSAGDLFLLLARQGGKPLSRTGFPAGGDFHAWLSARWDDLRRRTAGDADREAFWTKALRNGGVWEPAGKPVDVALRQPRNPAFTPPPRGTAGEIDLWAWGSIMLHDGRLANRGWMQEAPDPVTFIAWGNWIDLHPKTARELKIEQGEVAELATQAGALRAPVRITNDVTERTAAISFGQGHAAMGRTARGIGASVYPLLGVPSPGPFPPCRIRKVGERRPNDPTWTSPTREQHKRHIVEWVSLSELKTIAPGEGGELDLPLPEGYLPERDFYPKRGYLRYRWAMVVDLHRCIGCGACTVACYAENNIPVMGKKQVGRQLEMAWLRVPPYRKEGTSRYGWLPLLCQHCDAAPCEPVCPVYAAVHNEEGLNAQVYNRCIGTRYCSNNCPYKVRRFNWLNVEWRKPLDLQLNPEVTVRSRGVMEKCTFCIQRIRQAEYRATREKRRVADGEIQPACVQTCPTRVYTFGDLLDPGSMVSRLVKNDPRRYQVLQELNTKPAVIYLRRIENDVA